MSKHQPPYSFLLSIGVLGLSLSLHGVFAFGQTSFDSLAETTWRRTSIGWEHADSVPVRSTEMGDRNELQFPILNITLIDVVKTHRIALPLALTGFLACLGPWMLLQWPTKDWYSS